MDRGSTEELRHDRFVLLCGLALTLLLAGAVVAYALLTWSEPDRTVLLALGGAALLDAGVVLAFRVPLLRHRRRALWQTVWSVAHVVAIVVGALVDGGVASPLVVLLFVPVAYASAWYPPGAVLAVAAACAAGAFAIDLLDGRAMTALATFYEVCFVSLGVVAAVTARDRARSVARLRASQAEVVNRLSRAVEYRDPTTGSHIDRMSVLCAETAAVLGLAPARCHLLRMAASMHDVGKIAIPDAILDKPGPLGADERRVMERHAEIGHDMLAGSDSEILALGAEIAVTHHERWDGRGYPHGRAGEDIPIEGRIAAVCDVYDALTSDRPYRPALAPADALAIVRDGAGRQFDPAVVAAFERVVAEPGSRVTARALQARRLEASSTPWPGMNRSPA